MWAERKNGRTNSLAFWGLAAAALVIVAGARVAGATVLTWTGTTDANWSVGGAGGNWNGAGPPVSGDDIVFDNLSTANLGTNNNIGGLALSSITLANPTGGVSIGGNAFGIGSGGIDMSAATQDLSISPTLTLSGTPSLDVAAGQKLTVTATPTLASGSNVSKDGAGTLSFNTLYLGNNVSNTFTMNAGTMDIQGDCRMGQGGQTGTLNQYGGAIQHTGSFFIVGGVSGGTGGKGVYNIWDGSLVVNNRMYAGWWKDGEINIYGGSVTANNMDSATDGADGVVNLMGGSLTVTGTAQYGYKAGLQTDFVQTGGTASFGTLILGGGGSGGTANYTISDGTLDVGGTLNVGTSGTGLFKVVGDDATILVDGYTQNAASTLELDITGGISPINVDGTVSLAGALQLDSLPPPQWLPIILNDGTDAVVGIFAGLPEGTWFTPPGLEGLVQITYLWGDGNDVALYGIPEPGTMSLLGLGALALIRRRRRP